MARRKKKAVPPATHASHSASIISYSVEPNMMENAAQEKNTDAAETAQGRNALFFRRGDTLRNPLRASISAITARYFILLTVPAVRT